MIHLLTFYYINRTFYKFLTNNLLKLFFFLFLAIRGQIIFSTSSCLCVKYYQPYFLSSLDSSNFLVVPTFSCGYDFLIVMRIQNLGNKCYRHQIFAKDFVSANEGTPMLKSIITLYITLYHHYIEKTMNHKKANISELAKQLSFNFYDFLITIFITDIIFWK